MKNLARIIFFVVLTLFSLTRVKSIFVNGNNFLETLRPIIERPFASYDEKMAMKYPVYHDFIQDIKRIASEDSVIYLPEVTISRPQPMWPLSGIHITQPLLYPRNVKKLDLNNLPTKDVDGRETYIIVAYGYPEISLPNLKLILLVDDNNIRPDKYDSIIFKENNIAGLIIIE